MIPNVIKMYWRKRSISANELWRKWSHFLRKRISPVSAIVSQFCSCFGLFDTAGLTQYPYIVVIYKINVHSHQNSLESQRPPFLFVSKARTHKFFFYFPTMYVYCIYMLTKIPDIVLLYKNPSTLVYHSENKII